MELDCSVKIMAEQQELIELLNNHIIVIIIVIHAGKLLTLLINFKILL